MRKSVLLSFTLVLGLLICGLTFPGGAMGAECTVIVDGLELTDRECAIATALDTRIKQQGAEVSTLKQELSAERDQFVEIMADTVEGLAATADKIKIMEEGLSESSSETATMKADLAALRALNEKFVADLTVQYETLNARLDASVPNLRQ